MSDETTTGEAMTKKKGPDTGDLLSHTLEDVYVGEELKQHGRSVRMVTHEDSDTVELVSCDEDAVKRAKARLLTGNYTVRGSVLNRPSNAELTEIMEARGLRLGIGGVSERFKQLSEGKGKRKRGKRRGKR